MDGRYNYIIDWDPAKAAANFRKHGVSFDVAATALFDPLAVTTPDEAHSETEERLSTTGHTSEGLLTVVIHTWKEIGSTARVRIISARRATRQEKAKYYEGTQ